MLAGEKVDTALIDRVINFVDCVGCKIDIGEYNG